MEKCFRPHALHCGEVSCPLIAMSFSGRCTLVPSAGTYSQSRSRVNWRVGSGEACSTATALRSPCWLTCGPGVQTPAIIGNKLGQNDSWSTRAIFYFADMLKVNLSIISLINVKCKWCKYLINVKCKWCKYKIVLRWWTLSAYIRPPIRGQYPGHLIYLDQSGASIQVTWSLSPPTRHIPDEKFLITMIMMENGNLDKLTFYNLHFHTNWATFWTVKIIIFLTFASSKIIQLYFKRLLETLYSRSKMFHFRLRTALPIIWRQQVVMQTWWSPVARSDLCPPMTMTGDKAGGTRGDTADFKIIDGVSGDFKPIQPDPIYAPVRQRWVIKQNYFVMLETLALSLGQGSWMFN